MGGGGQGLGVPLGGGSWSWSVCNNGTLQGIFVSSPHLSYSVSLYQHGLRDINFILCVKQFSMAFLFFLKMLQLWSPGALLFDTAVPLTGPFTVGLRFCLKSS